jgi:hypothetical protein
MTRGVIAAVIGDQFDTLFEDHRSRQYDSQIKFSTLALSMADIALGLVKNRNQAYLKYQDELRASKAAYYGKINRCEPGLCEAVVRYSAEQAAILQCHLGSKPEPILPGYYCYTIDGNHLQKTEKRLQETRGLCAAPLPGTAVGRLDHQTGMFDRVYLLEDAHAQESVVLDRVLTDLPPGNLVLADRHFCIVDFLFKVANGGKFFLIRQHGRLKGTLRGQRRRVGTTETGEVFEQALEISNGDSTLVVRRITIELFQPTCDGDTELHVLSNVPQSDADGCQLADLYRRRWQIEGGFYVVTTTLQCEASSNCYPRAALFQFCMALVAYNCRQVLMTALNAEHDPKSVAEMSQYQLAIDVVKPMDGMLTAITEEEWQQCTPTQPSDLAAFLRQVAKHVDVKKYGKSKRGPKKPPPIRKRCRAGTHVSVAKLLVSRKRRC